MVSVSPDDYLSRIGIPRGTEPDLTELQRRHLQSVPFTNVHVLDGTGTTPDPDRTVSRIVAGDGGLCYDLNGAFAWLLEELDFDVERVSARPFEGGEPRAPFDHMALIVDDHLVDVGFGAFARQPIPLDGSVRSDVNGTYRIVDRGDGYVAQSREDGDWSGEYLFDATPRTTAAFAERAQYHSTNEDAPFTGRQFASLALSDGRVTLSGTSLTVRREGGRRKRTIAESHRVAVLEAQFGLSDGGIQG